MPKLAIKLAIDPLEGRQNGWPLRVNVGKTIDANDDAIICIWNDWPDDATTRALRDAAGKGRTIVNFVRPGLQETFASLPPNRQKELATLLPGNPIIDPSFDRAQRAVIPSPADAMLRDMADQRFQISAMIAQRTMGFDTRGDSRIFIAAAPTANNLAPSQLRGLVYRHTLNGGTVYTFSTLPEPIFSNLATHPVFLPLLVRTLPARCSHGVCSKC